MIFDKITGSIKKLAVDLFGQTNIKRTVLPVVKLFGQLQAIGLKLIFDVFLPTKERTLEITNNVFEGFGFGFCH